MKQLYIIVVLFLLNTTFVFAQDNKVEEMKDLLSDKSVSVNTKLALYDSISWFYLHSSFEESAQYAREGIKLARKHHDIKMEAVLYRNLGVAYYMYNIYDTADIYYDKAMELAKQAREESLEAGIIFAKANMHYAQFQFQEALTEYLKAITLFEHLNQKERICATYGNIAAIYNEMKNYAHAEQYVNKAMLLATELGDSLRIAHLYNKLMIIRHAQGKLDECLEYAEKSRDIFYAEGEYINMLLSMHQILIVYMEQEQFQKAFTVAEEALAIAQEIGHEEYIIESKQKIAQIYQQSGQFTLAEEYALEVLSETDSNDYRRLINLYLLLSDLYVNLGDLTQASNYKNLLIETFYKSFDETMASALAEMEVEYETEKKNTQIETLHKQKQLYVVLSIISGIGLILLVITLILLYRYQQQKQLRANEKIQQLEQEKQLVAAEALLDGENHERGRISRELHDGLGGLLTMAKLDLAQTNNTSCQDLGNVTSLLDKSICEMRRIAHNLMPESLLRFGLKPILEEFSKGSDLIHFYFYGNENRLNEKIEINIYRIATELINNALKHANAAEINVQLIQSEEKLSLTVQDNGKGFNIENTHEGLSTVRARVELLGASMNVFSQANKGSEITIELNLNRRYTSYR